MAITDKTLTQKGNKYHHGDLRGALLEAVRQLVERDGADGFKIAEACRLAGVSTAAPYKHFADRADILRALAMTAMARLGSAMAAAADAHPAGDPARIAALGQSYIDFARAEPGVFRLIFGMSEDHEGHAELEAMGDATLGLVERVVAEHLGIAADSQEARLRAYALWCFVHGHSFLLLDGKRAHQDKVPEDALLSLIGRAMLPARAN